MKRIGDDLTKEQTSLLWISQKNRGRKHLLYLEKHIEITVIG